MMTRASRVLKWIGAGAVLLGAAPIAYADTTPSPPPPEQQSAWCGGDPADWAGLYTIQQQDAQANFTVNGDSLTLTVDYMGTPAGGGTWQAGGGETVFSFNGSSYLSSPDSVVCDNPNDPSKVTSFSATTSPSSPYPDTVTLQRAGS
jgi:hypothetical protein